MPEPSEPAPKVMLPMVSALTVMVSLAAEPPKMAESLAVHDEIGASVTLLSQLPAPAPVPSQVRPVVVVLSLWPFRLTVLPSQYHVVAPRAVLRAKAASAQSARALMVRVNECFVFI